MDTQQRISFDFDDTLSKREVQLFAKALVNEGYDVWITTSRMNNAFANDHNWNDDLEMVADCVGIPTNNVVYCNLKPKWEIMKPYQFTVHLDDDHEDVRGINNNLNTIGVLYVETLDNRSLNRVREIL